MAWRDLPWQNSETSSKELGFKDPNRDNMIKVDKSISKESRILSKNSNITKYDTNAARAAFSSKNVILSNESIVLTVT